MARGKCSSKLCEICNKMVSLFAYNRHVKSHTSKIVKTILQFEPTKCKFCERVCITSSSLKNHERRCSNNKDRILHIKPDTGLKAVNTKRRNGTLNFTEISKSNQSKAMKLAVKKYPESYTSSNRGRTKQIVKYGLKFQGKWELTFYEYCLTSNIKILRTNEGFPYNWNGDRTYFPDFYLPDLDVYIEVKGYEVERDTAKWRDFPKTLIVIKKEQMKSIVKNTFDLVTYIGSVA